MKVILITLLLLLPAIDCHADEQDSTKTDATSAEASVFQYDGVWKPKSAMLSGILLPPPAVEAITLTVKGDTYEVSIVGEEHADTGTVTRDVNVTPHRLTIKSLEGPNKGKTILAIYEIKGPNAYRVCYDLSGKAFPEDFKSPKGSQHFLVGYRRQVIVPSRNQRESGTRQK